MLREEAIELLFDIQTDAVYNVLSDEKEALEMAIKALEQIRWIPCTERLPEDYRDVLVCDGVDMFVGWCEFDGLSKKWHSLDDNFDYDTPIIAWLPLPERYDAEKEAEA